jgi:hypothetical protein
MEVTKKKMEAEAKLEEYKEQLLQDFKGGLANQLKEKEANRKQEYEKFLKEKQMVDQIVQKIQEEDQR